MTGVAMKKHTSKMSWLLLPLAGVVVWALATSASSTNPASHSEQPSGSAPPEASDGSWSNPRQRPVLAARPASGRARPRLASVADRDQLAVSARKQLEGATTRQLTARIRAVKQRGGNYFQLSPSDRALYDAAVALRAERRSQAPASRRFARAGGAK